MDRRELHRRIVATESFLYGSPQDAPKVFDGGASYITPPVVKGARATRSAPSNGSVGYLIHVDRETGSWNVSQAER